MGKKLVDVEDLMVWAANELARKRPGGQARPPSLGLNRADREIVGKWDRPMGYPSVSPMFAAGLSRSGGARGDPPHDDALVVEQAIERLRLARHFTVPDCMEAVLCAGLGFALDAASALRRALGNIANLVLVHGRLASRPSLRLEPPAPSPKLAPNGKPGVWRLEAWAEPTFDDHAHAQREVETPVTSLKRRNQYPDGAYGVLEYSPTPQDLVEERAEYWGWRFGLAWLAAELGGKLESRTALAPRAAIAPWLGDRDGEPVRDLFAPGAPGVFGAHEAATLEAERRTSRRRTVAGGNIYAWRARDDGSGAQEA
jgi:hypothetical protein